MFSCSNGFSADQMVKHERVVPLASICGLIVSHKLIFGTTSCQFETSQHFKESTFYSNSSTIIIFPKCCCSQDEHVQVDKLVQQQRCLNSCRNESYAVTTVNFESNCYVQYDEIMIIARQNGAKMIPISHIKMRWVSRFLV